MNEIIWIVFWEKMDIDEIMRLMNLQGFALVEVEIDYEMLADFLEERKN